MARFRYICEGCHYSERNTGYERKTPFYCGFCSNTRYSENQKKHSGDYHLKKKLIKERGSTCEHCGVECKVMMHPKIQIKDGGETSRENCVLLCQDCHKKEHDGRGVGAVDYWYDKKFPSKA